MRGLHLLLGPGEATGGCRTGKDKFRHVFGVDPPVLLWGEWLQKQGDQGGGFRGRAGAAEGGRFILESALTGCAEQNGGTQGNSWNQGLTKGRAVVTLQDSLMEGKPRAPFQAYFSLGCTGGDVQLAGGQGHCEGKRVYHRTQSERGAWQ